MIENQLALVGQIRYRTWQKRYLAVPLGHYIITRSGPNILKIIARIYVTTSPKPKKKNLKKILKRKPMMRWNYNTMTTILFKRKINK
jgi:hypothetical protein